MSGSALRRAAALAPVALLASCGEAAASAMRASALLGLLALALGAVFRRRSPGRGARDLEIQARAWLARDAGVAVVRARDESLLVGWGRDGVRILSRLGREERP